MLSSFRNILRPFRLNRLWSAVPLQQPDIVNTGPANGSHLGGTLVTFLGSGFQNGAVAKFGGSGGIGGTPVATVFITAGHITAVSPAGPVGLADIVIVNPNTTESGASGFGLFTYT